MTRPTISVTVDVVLLTVRDGGLAVLLVQRGGEPFRGAWALPGGFVEPDEDLDVAAARELVEETAVGVAGGDLEQLAAYGTPGRDPRGRVVSVAHLGLVPDLPTPDAGSDAAAARWWAVEDLEGLPLAFDHDRIVADGIERARSRLEHTPLATRLLPAPFTLGELRRVYEAVWGVTLPAPAFERTVLSTPGFVEPVDDGPAVRAGGRRPARRHRRGIATSLHPPILRPGRAPGGDGTVA